MEQDFLIRFCELLFILKYQNYPYFLRFLQNLILKTLFLNSTSYITLREVVSLHYYFQDALEMAQEKYIMLHTHLEKM